MNSSTKWGVISGLSAGVWTVFIMILELNGISSGSSGLIPAWIFFIVGIYIGILQTRINEMEGYIDFRNAFRAGLRSAAFAALIWNVFISIFYMVISKDAMRKLFPLDSDIMLESRKTIMMQLSSFIIATVSTILLGTFLALILSLVLKKEPEEEGPQI